MSVAQQLVDITGLTYDHCESLVNQAGGSISVAVELALNVPKETAANGLNMVAHRLRNPAENENNQQAIEMVPTEALSIASGLFSS
jgi:hypothetical protein